MSRSKAVWFRASLLLAALLIAGHGPLAADEKGWQIGLGLGRSSLDEVFGDPEVRPKTFDDRAGASAVEVAYLFNRYVGVQGGYHDLGTFQGFGSSCPFDPETCRNSLILWAPAAAEAEVTGWSLAVLPSWPFTPRLAAYAKLGVLARETDVSTDVQLIDGSRDFDSLSGNDLLTGVGLRYRIGKSLGTRVEYQSSEVETASLGLTWAF